MKIEKIYTLANAKVEIQFLAMERSLRATGCDLPLYLIPFDDRKFDLPPNAIWVEDPQLFADLEGLGATPHSRKLHVFKESNAALFDTDIIHLKNPQIYLQEVSDKFFIVADTEWAKNQYTHTFETRSEFSKTSTIWLSRNFNSGFYAFSKSPIIDLKVEELPLKLIQGRTNAYEQPLINFMLFQSRVEVRNLCLPPFNMESTMAVDYPEYYEHLLNHPERGPFFLHFAGPILQWEHPIVEEFTKWLTAEEKKMWEADMLVNRKVAAKKWPFTVRALNRILGVLNKNFYVQPKPKEF